MRRIRSLGPWIVSLVAFSLSLYSFYSSHAATTRKNRQFTNKVLNSIHACVEYSSSISQKEQIYSLLDIIKKEFEVIEQGNDDIRIKFVNSQECMEHVLACFQALGEIDHLIGVIHTPMPATPLCVKPSGNVQDILDRSIRYNLDKLLTVRSRAQVIREYLMKGGQLYVTYPQGGLQKRSPEQQKIYREELDRFIGRLFDCALTTTQMQEDIIGATYLFRTLDKQVFAFSLKGRQANDVADQVAWGLWFGPVSENVVENRLNIIFDYLAEWNGPDLRKEPAFEESFL